MSFNGVKTQGQTSSRVDEWGTPGPLVTLTHVVNHLDNLLSFLSELSSRSSDIAHRLNGPSQADVGPQESYQAMETFPDVLNARVSSCFEAANRISNSLSEISERLG